MTNPRIGYVLKVFPRLSETFVLNEMLAHERAGLDIEVFSLRPAGDEPRHPHVARLRAPVVYVDRDLPTLDVWQERMDAAELELPGLSAVLTSGEPHSLRDFHQALTLAFLVRSHALTHLHAHFASAAATVTRLAAQLADVPWSFTAHAKDIFHESVDLADLRRKLRDATAAVTVSEFNRRHLLQIEPDAAERIHTIYNGVDLARLAYREPRNREPLIAGIGRLVEKKGFEYLIDACALLERRGVEFRCVILGDGERAPAVRERIAAHGLNERIELIGARTHENVVALLRKAAVMAAPCVVAGDGNRDGLPTVLLESMALGTPTVSTPVTGIPELIRHGDNGLLVPERDAERLADALERVLRRPADAVAMARAARATVETTFELHDNAARMRDLLFDARGATGAKEPIDDEDRVLLR